MHQLHNVGSVKTDERSTDYSTLCAWKEYNYIHQMTISSAAAFCKTYFVNSSNFCEYRKNGKIEKLNICETSACPRLVKTTVHWENAKLKCSKISVFQNRKIKM